MFRSDWSSVNNNDANVVSVRLTAAQHFVSIVVPPWNASSSASPLVSVALVACGSVKSAHAVLIRFDDHRFSALLHHYALSTWVLYARAYAKRLGTDARVRRVDAKLRASDSAIEWLQTHWIDLEATRGARPRR